MILVLLDPITSTSCFQVLRPVRLGSKGRDPCADVGRVASLHRWFDLDADALQRDGYEVVPVG